MDGTTTPHIQSGVALVSDLAIGSDSKVSVLSLGIGENVVLHMCANVFADD